MRPEGCASFPPRPAAQQNVLLCLSEEELETKTEAKEDVTAARRVVVAVRHTADSRVAEPTTSTADAAGAAGWT